MEINRDTLFANPQLYLMSYETDHARFMAMDRESFANSIFLDDRIVPGPERKLFRIPLNVLLEDVAGRGYTPPRLGIIHQVAQCGSTLLARALDHAGRSLVFREPQHLRQLGVLAGADFELAHASRELRGLVGLSMTMLGKREFEGEAMIVKGNVPIAMIGEVLLDADPEQAGIMLHLPLEDYCAAVMRTPDHQKWVESVTTELRLGAHPLVGDLSSASIGERCGALWLVLMERFARFQSRNERFHSLDANVMFARPAETIAAAAAHFGIAMTPEEAQGIASGPLFATYAKNPSMPYAPGLREERRAAAKEALKAEIADARAFVEARWEKAGVGERLVRPLVQAGEPLLA